LEGNGVVKWFSDNKGYGFVVLDGSQQDVFVHHSKIVMDGFRSLIEGMAVEIEYESGDKGLTATSVRPVAKTSPA